MKIALIAFSSIMILSVIFNSKTSLFKIIKNQFFIYKNDKNKKIKISDIFTFYVVPLILAILIAFQLEFEKFLEKTELLITIFSVIATVLLSFLAILAGINYSKKTKGEQVLQETFLTIIMDVLYSLIIVIILLCVSFCGVYGIWPKIIIGFNSYFVIKVVLNMLLILKRMYLLIKSKEN